MVDRDFRGGFKLALKAKDDEDRVLQLDPNYVDAKLVVGIYQYVVGALPWPFKILIGFAGITGSKSTGLAMLHDAGERGVITSMEARTATALFLRRESAIKRPSRWCRALKSSIPTTSSSALKKPICARMRARAWSPSTPIAICGDDARPGYFPEAQLELAYFGLGDALRGQRHYSEAAEAYEKAAWTADVGPELKIRSLLDAGECRDAQRRARPCREGLSGRHRRRPHHLPRRHRKKVPSHPLPRKLTAHFFGFLITFCHVR